MLSYERGEVIEILSQEDDIDKIKVRLEDRISDSINYKKMTGGVKIGDFVVVNTTAVNLKLGTGGVDFVINNLNNIKKNFTEEGHIMKLRYTPLQVKCSAVDSQESSYHNDFLDFEDLDGHPVVVGSLHSMLAPIVTCLKYLDKDLKITYIMTDGGSLPLAFSNTVKNLKKDNLIDKTITIGHAFGGDLECVNIYNGLIASKEILKSDITIITMGPGIVGTGTKYGFSGIEQGEIINAVNTLGGKSIMVPRIGFRDERERHRGLSHHTQTVLEKVVKTSTTVVLGEMESQNRSLIDNQIAGLKLESNIDFVYENGDILLKAMEKFNYNTRTMGRDITEEKEYFSTLGAIAKYSYKVIKKEDI